MAWRNRKSKPRQMERQNLISKNEKVKDHRRFQLGQWPGR
jgi:hypothetical protein